MKDVSRRDFFRGVLSGGAVSSVVAGVGGFELGQALTRAPKVVSDSWGMFSYTVFRSDTTGKWVARNGTTGREDYAGTAASVLASVNTALATDGGTAYLKGPCNYGSITWTLRGRTAVLLEPTVTGLALASDGTWLGNVQTVPALRPYVLLTPNGPFDGGDFGPNSS
jgi:hypothetical protein